MILSFRDPQTEAVFERRFVRGLGPEVQRMALRRLIQIHKAANLDDLRQPPGNRLEALKANRAGQHSIRINDQWRICFVWRGGNAYQVEIVDYH